MVNSQQVKDFLTGKVEKEFLVRRLVPVLILIMWICILISNLFFPTAYDWRYMVISDLTSPHDNPKGFLFLSIGMGICGALMIPIPGYMHRRLKVFLPKTTIFGTFFFSLGVLGLISVGLIYDQPGQPNRLHENLAIVAFGGLLFGIFFWGFPIIKDNLPRYHGKRQFDPKLWWLAVGMMWFGVLGTGLSTVYLEVVDNDWGWVGIDWIGTGAPVLASFAVWEWMIFIFLLFYIYILIKVTPETVEPLVSAESSTPIDAK